MADRLDPIEKEIQKVFDKLSETMPNASFLYSYVYATTKDPKTAKVRGRINMRGSKEEIEIHLEELQKSIKIQEELQQKRKDKVYGTKKDRHN